MHVNKVHHVKTISRVARELGENEDWLFDVAIEMEPEDGVIWVYGADEDGEMAFTDFGIESLIDLIKIHKGDQGESGQLRATPDGYGGGAGTRRGKASRSWSGSLEREWHSRVTAWLLPGAELSADRRFRYQSKRPLKILSNKPRDFLQSGKARRTLL
jgi:hypothetical protein